MNKNSVKKFSKSLISATLRGLAVFLIFGAAIYAYAAVTYPANQPNPVSGVVGLYVGKTPATYDGNDAGSYQGAKSGCENAFPASHVCTPMEMVNTYNHNPSAVTGQSGFVWLNAGSPANTTPAVNDCDGWKSIDYSFYGLIWVFDTTHAAGIAPCPFSFEYACCK